VTAITPGKGQRFEEAWHSVIGHAATIAAGLVTERASDPTFPEPGLTGNQQILMAVDPGSVDQMRHDDAIDAAGRAQIEILDTGGLAEGRKLQAGGQALGVAFGGLAIHEQAEPILEAEGLEGRACAALFIQRLGHSGQAERDEALGGGVGQHGFSPCQW